MGIRGVSGFITKARTQVITTAMNSWDKNLPANPQGRQVGRWLCSTLAFSWLQAQGFICSLAFSLLSVTAARSVLSELRTVRGVRSAKTSALWKPGEGDEGQGWQCWGQTLLRWDGADFQPLLISWGQQEVCCSSLEELRLKASMGCGLGRAVCLERSFV